MCRGPNIVILPRNAGTRTQSIGIMLLSLFQSCVECVFSTMNTG